MEEKFAFMFRGVNLSEASKKYVAEEADDLKVFDLDTAEAKAEIFYDAIGHAFDDGRESVIKQIIPRICKICQWREDCSMSPDGSAFKCGEVVDFRESLRED